MPMYGLPDQLPQLSSYPDPSQGWPANVYKACEIMSDIYHQAFHVLHQEESDPLQILFHIDSVSSDAISLLEVLENSEAELGFQFPREWLLYNAELFGKLVLYLHEAVKKMKTQFVHFIYGTTRYNL